jgi:hypothetical protein
MGNFDISLIRFYMVVCSFGDMAHSSTLPHSFIKYLILTEALRDKDSALCYPLHSFRSSSLKIGLDERPFMGSRRLTFSCS